MKLNQLLATFAIALAVLITGCKKDDFEEVPGTCPIVVNTDPVNLATFVPLDKIITATFNVNMNPETIIPEAFNLQDAKKSAGAATPGALTYDATSKTMRFVPTSPLTNNTTYTATIKSTAKDLNGIALAGDYAWTFSTGVLVNPTVISTDPLNLATGVVLNKTITANFSEAMDVSTLTETTFTLLNGVTPVAGAVSYTGTTASFNPTVNLLPGVLYTATITTGAKNVAGTPLAADYIWTFATFSAVPTVIVPNPINLATNIPLNKTVTVTFSTAMNNATISGTTFTLFDDVTQVSGVVSYAGTTASFNPDVNLLPSVLYTATITTGAQSTSGTALASNYVWTFTTIAAGIPFIISTVPQDLAINVPLTQVISADFSEAMNSATITSSTFTLMNGATPVTGTVNYAGTTATFTPDIDLILGATYEATVTTGAQNLGGTGIADDYVWTFSTGASVSVGPGIVNLGTSGNFAILSKAGISTTGVTSIIGDLGISPATSTAITGFGLIMDASNEFAVSPIVTGNVYASDYAPPTPAYVTTAISDMEAALISAMGMTLSVITELGAGDISGMTLAPGLYKWGTGLLITGAGVTLSGGPDDTWVFQISDDFTVNGDVILSGGAQAKNIFWVTNTQALLNTGVDFSGNILAQTLIDLKTGAKVTGLLLSQTAVTLDAATVIKP